MCVLLQVFYGIPYKPGDVVITSVAEYGSNYLAYLQVSHPLAFELPDPYALHEVW